MDDLSPTQLQSLAITAALSANWQEALQLNLQIIDTDPKNVEALNRLGRAYFELCDLKNSQKYFETSLSHDPYNQIAAKFLKRIAAFSKKGVKQQMPTDIDNHNHAQINCDLFIEEPGITKLVNLLKVAEPQKLSLLSPGLLVNLIVKNHCLAATDNFGEYLGVLPDDTSHHLIRLIKGGNKYQALIKTIKPNGVTILIREVYRSARFKNQPSFLDNLNNTTITYSSGNIIVGDDMDEPFIEGDEEESI